MCEHTCMGIVHVHAHNIGRTQLMSSVLFYSFPMCINDTASLTELELPNLLDCQTSDLKGFTCSYPSSDRVIDTHHLSKLYLGAAYHNSDSYDLIACALLTEPCPQP